MGWRDPARITRPLDMLGAWGADHRQAEVVGIDADRRRVDTSGGPIDYDALVVALGASLDADAVPGLSSGLTPYTLAGAQALRDAWPRLESGRVAVVVAGMPYKCPAAPYETALLLESGWRGLRRRDAVQIDLYTPEPLPLPVAGPAVGEAVRDMLTGRGIGFHPGRQVTEVDAQRKQIAFADGDPAAYDMLVYVPPHRGPVAAASLADDSGWIPVDPRTLETAADGVYAVGDAAKLPLPPGGLLPKAGVFAHGEARIVARRIADRLAGRTPSATFDGWGGCFVETGDGRAAYGRGDFLAAGGPAIRLERPARGWHLAKAAFERSWLWAMSDGRVRSRLGFALLDGPGPRVLEAGWLWGRW